MKIGIIFDLDGTLWDTVAQITDSWNKTVDKLPDVDFHFTQPQIRLQMGKLMEDIARSVMPGIDEKRRLEILKLCCDEEQAYLEEHGGNLYKGLEEVLAELYKKYELYIVSNCQEGYIEVFLKAHNLDRYFIDTENAGRTGLPKAGNIKLIVKRNNLDKAFYVGDIQGDYDSATAAGVPFIHAAYGFGKINDETLKIQSIKELPELLEKIL